MMYDDFGGGGVPVAPYTDGMTMQQLKREVRVLTEENDKLKNELKKYRKAPVRRLLSNIHDFLVDWFAPLIAVSMLMLFITALVYGNKERDKRHQRSCAFAAKIQDTNFEFDTDNNMCYLFDKSTKRFKLHASYTTNPN